MNPSVLKTSMAAYFQRVGNLADRESLASPVAFIQYFKEVLPEALNRTDWGEGDAFIDLVAGGRLPKTPMQWVVATADRWTCAKGWWTITSRP